jgi:hypothetical protein
MDVLLYILNNSDISDIIYLCAISNSNPELIVLALTVSVFTFSGR